MNTKGKSAEGIVFGIQRFSIHDGPGIRTTVFLKGCNIRCKWCHNPEGIPMAPILGYNDGKCLKCGECVRVCPNGCHQIIDGVHTIKRDICVVCGKCVDVCPETALEKIGNTMSADEVFSEVIKDKKYYEEQGGVTLSGGEPLLQKKFLIEILKRCKNAGVHCAVETNGVHPFSDYKDVAPYVDLFLMDYKLTDPAKHREFTGIDNSRVIDNIHKLHDSGAKILMRCPIIPGVNDTRDHFDAIVRLSKELPNLVGVEILTYHKMGVSKSVRIGEDAIEYPVPSEEKTAEWKGYMVGHGARLINLK